MHDEAKWDGYRHGKIDPRMKTRTVQSEKVYQTFDLKLNRAERTGTKDKDGHSTTWEMDPIHDPIQSHPDGTSLTRGADADYAIFTANLPRCRPWNCSTSILLGRASSVICTSTIGLEVLTNRALPQGS